MAMAGSASSAVCRVTSGAHCTAPAKPAALRSFQRGLVVPSPEAFEPAARSESKTRESSETDAPQDEQNIIAPRTKSVVSDHSHLMGTALRPTGP